MGYTEGGIKGKLILVGYTVGALFLHTHHKSYMSADLLVHPHHGHPFAVKDGGGLPPVLE